MTKYVYLGPASRFSPRDDKDGNPEPFVTPGCSVELSDEELDLWVRRGQQFEGHQAKPGDPLVGYPGAPAPPPPMVVTGPPETAPPAGPVATFGGQRTPTEEEQREAAEHYRPMPMADDKEDEDKPRSRHRS